MERFPRGSLPPSAFRAVATVAPHAVARAEARGAAGDADARATVAPVVEQAECDLTTTCPTCLIEMHPEHAHYRCPLCGYRDSCCF